MHLKRQEVPKNWPIARKGSTYVVNPNSNMGKGVPVLIVLRDMLKIVKNRNEAKKAINSKNIVLNGFFVKDEKESMTIFDKISIIPSKKNYQLTLSEIGKFSLEEVSEEESKNKIAKVLNKKTLKGKKVQLNLNDGWNFITNQQFKIQDSVIIDFKQKKIVKSIPLKESAKAMVFAGKHSGKKGIIKKVNLEKKMVELEDKKEKINALIKQIIVIE